MNSELLSGHALAGALALVPALALWAAWPRRRWVSWPAAAACFLLWAAGFSRVEPAQWIFWIGSGLWSLLASLYAAFVVERNWAEYSRLQGLRDSRRKLQGELTVRMAAIRAQGLQIEQEQREVMALYGMVKGLSESMTWEDLRPKLETAIQQYLRVEEFALYAVSSRLQDSLQVLVRRRLGDGTGSSWETLRRCLQEQRLSVSVAHVLRAPERAVALPVFETDKLVGYFYARIPAGVEPEALLTKAQNFVEEISFAFRRIQLFQDVEELSQTDGLTGVFRRGMFDERLREEVVRAKTFHTTFCLMMLDIDRFKDLNDSYGHPFGDQVLKRIGELLRANVYETDFVARYGGEEFAILLPRAEPAGVLRKAEALRKAVEEESFELAGRRVQTTISIGISHFPRDADSGEAVLRNADQALYAAKQAGRNRVVDVSQRTGRNERT